MAEAKKVTRIKASDDAPVKKPAAKASTAKASKASATKTTKAVKAKAVAKKQRKANKKAGYFKGAWLELRQVRWPNRKATWALTVSVLIFSLAFLGLIVALDMLFKFLFELIIA